MPAGEKGAVGVVEGYDLQSHCAAHDALQKWDRTSSVVLTLGGCPLGEFCCMIFHGFAAWRSEPVRSGQDGGGHVFVGPTFLGLDEMK